MLRRSFFIACGHYVGTRRQNIATSPTTNFHPLVFIPFSTGSVLFPQKSRVPRQRCTLAANEQRDGHFSFASSTSHRFHFQWSITSRSRRWKARYCGVSSTLSQLKNRSLFESNTSLREDEIMLLRAVFPSPRSAEVSR